MCRLAFITRRFKELPNWLGKLEKSAGGDGTGLANPRVGMTKSVGLSALDSVDLMDEYPVLWHTRRVSSGSKKDSLCHPFECDGGWMVHNGHWHAGHIGAQGWADLMGGSDISDTAYFAMLVDNLGFEYATMKYAPTGVWLHMNGEGKLAVWKNSGDKRLYYCRKLRAWGSEPADQGDWYEVEDGWYDYGQIPNRPKRKKLVEKPGIQCFPSGFFAGINQETGQVITSAGEKKLKFPAAGYQLIKR